MKMLPIILDNNFNRIAMIDDFISLIWTTRYYKTGDFEVCADISRANVLKVGYYVTRAGDDSHLGIIENVDFTGIKSVEVKAVAKVFAGADGEQLQIRLDANNGELLGYVDIGKDTGGAEGVFKASLYRNVTGVHNVYLLISIASLDYPLFLGS